jgi:hypothetical protein
VVLGLMSDRGDVKRVLIVGCQPGVVDEGIGLRFVAGQSTGVARCWKSSTIVSP